MVDSLSENGQKMLRGELFLAYTPEMVRLRRRCANACGKFNSAVDPTRRQQVALIREILDDHRPLPPELPSSEDDAALFEADPWIEAPLKVDYGFNLRIGVGAFLNFNCTVLDSCLVSIGPRTLVGPNVSFYSGTHPLDPEVRNGINGPEMGKEIHIGEDCWIGGQVVILSGVKIGRGCTIGAGSVVTRSVPGFHVVAGNPAKILRRIKTRLDPEQRGQAVDGDETQGAEKPMADFARTVEGTS